MAVRRCKRDAYYSHTRDTRFDRSFTRVRDVRSRSNASSRPSLERVFSSQSRRHLSSVPAKGFGMDAFAFSANPRNAPMDLFTGDLAAAALYSAASRSSCCGRRCMAPTC